jgi:hypothetical protein
VATTPRAGSNRKRLRCPCSAPPTWGPARCPGADRCWNAGQLLPSGRRARSGQRQSLKGLEVRRPAPRLVRGTRPRRERCGRPKAGRVLRTAPGGGSPPADTGGRPCCRVGSGSEKATSAVCRVGAPEQTVFARGRRQGLRQESVHGYTGPMYAQPGPLPLDPATGRPAADRAVAVPGVQQHRRRARDGSPGATGRRCIATGRARAAPDGTEQLGTRGLTALAGSASRRLPRRAGIPARGQTPRPRGNGESPGTCEPFAAGTARPRGRGHDVDRCGRNVRAGIELRTACPRFERAAPGSAYRLRALHRRGARCRNAASLCREVTPVKRRPVEELRFVVAA